MALLAPQVPGGALVYANASASDTYRNTGSQVLHVRNAGAGACTVTIVGVAACNQGTVHSQAYNVPAGEDRIIPAQSPDRFNNVSGLTTVTFSPTTSVTVAVLATS